MSKIYEYETKQGMLKYTLNDVKTTLDDEMSLLMEFESYKTGITFETLYESEDIKLIHKLFELDDALIVDLISTNTLMKEIKINSKQIEVIYKLKVLKREYTIILSSDKVVHEGVDPAFGDLQRQNKVLLRQVSKLTDHVAHMDKQFEKLAFVVASGELNCQKPKRRNPNQDHISLDHMHNLVNINKIMFSSGTSYVQWVFANTCGIEYKRNITIQNLLKYDLDMNICDTQGQSILINKIIQNGNDSMGLDYIKVIIERGADVNHRDKSGKHL